MKLKLRKTFNYGQFRAYPDCETSERLAEWIEKKTFSKEDLKALVIIGFEIELTS